MRTCQHTSRSYCLLIQSLFTVIFFCCSWPCHKHWLWETAAILMPQICLLCSYVQLYQLLRGGDYTVWYSWYSQHGRKYNLQHPHCCSKSQKLRRQYHTSFRWTVRSWSEEIQRLQEKMYYKIIIDLPSPLDTDCARDRLLNLSGPIPPSHAEKDGLEIRC